MNTPDANPAIRYERVRSGTRNYDEIERIYVDSFPAEERVPLDSLLSAPEGVQSDLMAVKIGEDVVGMCCVIRNDRLTFLFYLAVSDKCRNLGLGQTILEHVRSTYASPIFLNIELVSEDLPQTDIRVRRRSFYRRNGFSDTGMVLCDGQGEFNILSDSEADVEEYGRFLESLGWGSCAVVPNVAKQDTCKYP